MQATGTSVVAAPRHPSQNAPRAGGPVSWERMLRAVERVRERLTRAVRALEAAGIPYALAGGNAVAAWGSHLLEPPAE